MYKYIFLIFIVFGSCASINNRYNDTNISDLKRISETGKFLFKYDKACWIATDSIMGRQKKIKSNIYIADYKDNTWIVCFGSIDIDKNQFLVDFEVFLDDFFKVSLIKEYKTTHINNFYLNAAKSLDIAKNDFGEKMIPYNSVIIKDTGSIFNVFFIPAQTQKDIYPLGGDNLYITDSKKNEIKEKIQLHRTINYSNRKIMDSLKVVKSVHTAILTNTPVETDVFHVLRQSRKIPEVIITRNQYFEIDTLGNINILKN